MFLKKPGLLLALLVFLAIVAFAFAMLTGSASVRWPDVLSALIGNAPDNVHTLIIELRVPRALSAMAVGGLLAVSGVLMQVLLRNPLAEPYILGSSGGAAVAALLAIMLGLGATAV
ncbi:MAG: iron chelate uptake ABC transporter family permease subunit, partial [Woeseiaceae bacterium]